MFELNGVYRNRIGEYTVVALNGPRMVVRYADGSEAVSYTHLDVYKRQVVNG